MGYHSKINPGTEEWLRNLVPLHQTMSFKLIEGKTHARFLVSVESAQQLLDDLCKQTVASACEGRIVDAIDWPEAGIHIFVVECPARMELLSTLAEIGFVKSISPDATATIPPEPT